MRSLGSQEMKSPKEPAGGDEGKKDNNTKEQKNRRGEHHQGKNALSCPEKQ